MPDEIKVEQCDREAAASVAVLVEMRELILAGKADHHAEPFARHRTQHGAQGEPVAWQPIETAPKDGTVIDVWRDGHRDTVYWGYPPHCCGEMGQYCDSDWHGLKEQGWICSTFGEFVGGKCNPFTAWMLIPPPPGSETVAAHPVAINPVDDSGAGNTIVNAPVGAQGEQLAEAQRESEWQPMETAPKDGTFVQLFEPIAHPPVSVGCYDDEAGWLIGEADFMPSKCRPRCWAPLLPRPDIAPVECAQSEPDLATIAYMSGAYDGRKDMEDQLAEAQREIARLRCAVYPTRQALMERK